MEDWAMQLISTVGVPGAICFYVLVSLKKTIDANTKTIAMIAGKLGVPNEQQ